jgi:hypothetical protein
VTKLKIDFNAIMEAEKAASTPAPVIAAAAPQPTQPRPQPQTNLTYVRGSRSHVSRYNPYYDLEAADAISERSSDCPDTGHPCNNYQVNTFERQVQPPAPIPTREAPRVNKLERRLQPPAPALHRDNICIPTQPVRSEREVHAAADSSPVTAGQVSVDSVEMVERESVQTASPGGRTQPPPPPVGERQPRGKREQQASIQIERKQQRPPPTRVQRDSPGRPQTKEKSGERGEQGNGRFRRTGESNGSQRLPPEVRPRIPNDPTFRKDEWTVQKTVDHPPPAGSAWDRVTPRAQPEPEASPPAVTDWQPN